MILLALSAAPSMYASELSMMPFGVANPVQIDITFSTSSGVTLMGLASDDDPALTCGSKISAPYLGGPAFALGAPPTKTAYFNGFLPATAADIELCVHTASGTIALDGIETERGDCIALTGCYSYACDRVGGSVTSITVLIPFTATCS